MQYVNKLIGIFSFLFILTWKEDDVYADQIMERVLNSVELIKLTEKEK